MAKPAQAMQALHFVAAQHGACTVRDLDLRMPQVSGIIDPEPFRARARGEGPALAEAFAQSGGMRSLQGMAGQSLPLFDLPGPVLTFVIAGQLAVDTVNRGLLRLAPGDLFLAHGGSELEACFTQAGDCRLVQVLVADDWPGPRARPVPKPAEIWRRNDASKVLRMAQDADGKSRFHSFNALFSTPGHWSAITPLIGLRFIGMAPDTVIDWHPEIVNNLVIVLSGALELETGGGSGAVEVFYEGDICLAEDRTGQGHIDRMHGHVQVAVLIVDNNDLWPQDTAASP